MAWVVAEWIQRLDVYGLLIASASVTVTDLWERWATFFQKFT
jgi:hypothetical protein